MAKSDVAPLLLAAREVARGPSTALPLHAEVAASAMSATRLAALFRSRAGPQRLRLVVVDSIEDQELETPELLELPSEAENEQAAADETDEEQRWTLAWSPDDKFLVVGGRVMWLVTRPEWLDAAATPGPPLLLPLDPKEFLTPKQWTPAAPIVGAFFPSHSGSQVFVLSGDGVWLSVGVQLAKLALVAMDRTASRDTTGLFTMKVVKKLTEWHAGVTAACYEPESKILVVSGGLKDPSADLVEKQASSLSVWKVADQNDKKEVAELLDYTMVVKRKRARSGEGDVDADADASEPSDPISLTTASSGGLLASVKSSLFAPLKMVVGTEATETHVMRGSIRHLALAPGGNFVSMLDDLGRLAIRQIDACADVLKWQTVGDLSVAMMANTQGCAMKDCIWLTPDILALFLTNGSIIYSRLVAHSEEGVNSGPTSSDSENETAYPLGPSGRLMSIPVKHHKSTTLTSGDNMQVSAFTTNGHPLSEKDSFQFTACEFTTSGTLWIANLIRNVALGPFIELLMNAQHFNDALATAVLFEDCGKSIDVDTIHRRVWMNYRAHAATVEKSDHHLSGVHDTVFLSTRRWGLLHHGERGDFMDALDHLRAISDKKWAIDECLNLVTDDSSTNMKKILDLAYDALTRLADEGEITTELTKRQKQLQRYMYRLETLQGVLCEEDEVLTTSTSADQTFDGTAYVVFRSTPLLMTAKQFAREGRVEALRVLFHRHAWNLLPHWLTILELIPPSISPTSYAQLLPARSAKMEDGQICTLSALDDLGQGANSDNASVIAVMFVPENRRDDLTDDELKDFEQYSKMSHDEYGPIYGEWFTKRILDMDTRYGQLGSAYELSLLARKCLSGWTAQEIKQPYEDFFLHTERLYKCVYPLHLSACCLLPLAEWSSLSLQEQVMIVVGNDSKELVRDVSIIIDRLDTVFVSQRRDHTYALDDLFAWLAQTILSKPSLTSLELSAQLLHHSNPSLALTQRWIQNDAQLIETALDVIYSVDVAGFLGEKAPSEDEDAYLKRHLALVEQLWTIFQSLPVRKEDDPPEVAQLQVAVDEMEDLMVTMDVLGKYGVVTSPSGLKYRMLTSACVGVGATIGTSVGPRSLLERMCDFALPGEYSDDEESSEGSQWLEVLQDAVKLKEHAFGERLSQEMILDVILKHLLTADHAYVDAAQNLVSHWIISDVEAVDHVLDELIIAIRARLDSVTGYSEEAKDNAAHETALHCIDMARQLLSLPLWNEGDRAASGAKQYYEDTLTLETDGAHACELLDLLTYGAIKLSPSRIREGQLNTEEQGNARLDAVYEVFSSNPSNYKPSVRAREWLARHHGSGLTEEEPGTDVWNKPLAAVMHLAKLLRVDSQKLEIWTKGAYAALYCMDYDVAYDLTMQVINGISCKSDAATARHAGSGSGNDLTLVHLISLVLDLVSASSFRSWDKKRKLCCALLSSLSISSNDLFAHQVTDLVLSWLGRIEAIQALRDELGLSDDALEQRRLAGGKQTGSGVEAVLLIELKVVVDLLHEEQNDRQFLLRLLQRGFQLLQVMTNSDGGTENQDNHDNHDNSESLSTFLQQMVQLCIMEAVELGSVSGGSPTQTSDSRQYLELGFSYLMLWSNLCSDDDIFEGFCKDEVLPLVFSQQYSADSNDEAVHTSEAVIRRFHHLFLLLAAQERDITAQNEKETILARKQRLETLSSSYEATRRFVGPGNEQQPGALSEVTPEAEKSNRPQLVASEQRHDTYLQLAQQCQERLISQKKSQELEQMSNFFNTELDLERFSQDEGYRNEKIMVLATKKEHLHVSRQFATKYGIDEYQCVLAYIKHALLFPSDSGPVARHDELEQAFQSEQVDILEEALQRPFSFGDFLLGAADGEGIYESLDGTDHVGILLVLRMVLECSKRIYQQPSESVSPNERSFFPLPKPSIDRITLLFMCLKKLKDIADSIGRDEEPVNLKLVSAATTTAELLTPLSSSHTDPHTASAKRQVAVEAVRPLLSGNTIKFVTKFLRKMHRVTPSAMVMVYINDLLTGIWREHGVAGSSTAALSADLGAYAYESCVPCLSVLSNEHLLLFHHLFLDGSNTKSPPQLVAHLNFTEEFYGQTLSGLQRFGALLSAQKRMEIVADTLSLFQTKYNAWQISGPRSNFSSASSTSSTSSVSWDPAQSKRKEQELHFLERELAERVCCQILSEIDQNGMTFGASGPKASKSLESVVAALKAWFSMDSMQQAASEEDVFHKRFLVELCQCVTSVNLATLIMEIVLRTGKASSEDVVDTISQSYRGAVANLVDRCLDQREEGSKQTTQWTDRLAWTWVTGSTPASGTNARGSSQLSELECYLRTILCKADNGNDREVYERVAVLLAQSPSTLLREIALPRLENLQATCHDTGSRKRVQEAVLSQWEQQILLREDHHDWTKAAILSFVLSNSHSDNNDITGTTWHFGLHMKAVWSALLVKHTLEKSNDHPRVLETSSRDIFDEFDDVFEDMLAFVEAQASHKAWRFAEQATMALGNLLVRYDGTCRGVDQTAEGSAAAWQDEQKRAVQARIEAQFQVGNGAKNQRPLQSDESAASWSALFSRGYWGGRLLLWYSTHAYAKLGRKEEVTEAVFLAHWEANSVDVACQLLLMCPFDGLREKYASQVLSSVLLLPRGSGSWCTVMELALLRFDVSVLLQHRLHSSLVAFLLQNEEPSLWTSSGEYVVCALVMQGEFAAAGRLICALRRAHPLLWDVENARLLVANFLRALITSPTKAHDADLSRLQHEVYAQASRHFSSAMM